MTTELTRHGDSPAEPEKGKRRRGRTEKGVPAVAPEAGEATKKSAGKAKAVPTATDSVRRQEPRVDLLPPEVKASRRNDAIARRLMVALVVVIVVVAGAIAATTFLAIQANASLAAAQQQTVSLTQQQQKYVKVRAVQSQIALTQAGQEVGASTEIDWTAFLAEARATIGSGLTLKGITIDSASPLAAYEQPTVPLQGARVATVTLDVKATSLDAVSAWLAQLATIPAVADVSPGTITLDQSGYSASAILHLNESAFDNRFAPKGK